MRIRPAAAAPQMLSVDQFKRVRRVVVSTILATDNSGHAKLSAELEAVLVQLPGRKSEAKAPAQALHVGQKQATIMDRKHRETLLKARRSPRHAPSSGCAACARSAAPPAPRCPPLPPAASATGESRTAASRWCAQGFRPPACHGQPVRLCSRRAAGTTDPGHATLRTRARRPSCTRPTSPTRQSHGS